GFPDARRGHRGAAVAALLLGVATGSAPAALWPAPAGSGARTRLRRGASRGLPACPGLAWSAYMSAARPIPRMALTWLLVAQVLVILPHLLHLPAWIIGLWLLCAGWRIQVFRMRARFPSGLERAGLMIATAAAVFFSRGSLIGLDGGVLLLVAAFILKLVELRSRRDALLVIFLGFFVVVTSYLFDDGLLSALYSLLPVT